MKRLQILFWRTVAIVYDLRPSNLPQKYTDYPIAWRWDNGETEIYFPENIKVLHEWREKGKHWIAFSR